MAKTSHRPELRAKVREYLSLVPAGRRATLAMVTSGVGDLCRVDQRKPDEAEIRSLLGWLIDRGEVAATRNPELEREEYALR